jgi:eukaryotic-like serine/threonine-protein kinase
MASDVYGLGAVLYSLLTGCAPFRGDSVAETLEQVRERPPEPPSRLNPRTPRDLEIICLKCLEKDPARRYATAAELAEELRRHLDGEPIQARPVGCVERAWLWCRRNPSLAVAISSAIAALVATAVIATASAIHQAQAAMTERSLRADLTRAFIQVKSERDKADQERRAAQQLAAGMMYERGRSLSEQGTASHGLLWMARALELTPPDNRAFQRFIRANLAAWRPVITSLRWESSIPTDPNHSVRLSPDGKTILTTGWSDEAARLWRADDGSPIGQPMTHQGGISAAAFSPDGKTVLTGGRVGMARLWRAADGSPIGQPMTHQGTVEAVAFSPDGRTILIGGYGQVWLRRADDGSPIGRPLAHRGAVRAVAFSPDGRTILTGGYGEVQLSRAADGSPIGQPLIHQGGVRAEAFSPDGKTVATAGEDRTARLWRTADGAAVGQSMAHQDMVATMAYSLDGKAILTVGSYGTAQLWLVPSSTVIGDFRRVTAWVQLATESELGDSGAVRFLDDRTWQERSSQLNTLGGPPGWAVPLSTVDGDPRRITVWIQVLTGLELDDNGVVRSLDVKKRQERRRLLDELGGPPMP